MEWFVGRDGETSGPFALDELQQAARDGRLGRDDYVWRSGMEEWVRAGSVEKLWGPPPIPTVEPSSIDARVSEIVELRQPPSKAKRYVPLVSGLFAFVFFAVILFGVEAWWRYLLAVPLLAYASFSLKVALFASDEAIRGLTEPGPREKTLASLGQQYAGRQFGEMVLNHLRNRTCRP